MGGQEAAAARRLVQTQPRTLVLPVELAVVWATRQAPEEMELLEMSMEVLAGMVVVHLVVLVLLQLWLALELWREQRPAVVEMVPLAVGRTTTVERALAAS